MEKFQITQENGIVKIGNVVLTKESIETLEKLQDDSYGFLNDYIEALGNTVCFLARTQFHFGVDYEKESQASIADLSLIREDLMCLRNTPKNERPTKIEKAAIDTYVNSD